MRKWLLITTALVSFSAAPKSAEADPVLWALIGNGVGVGAAVTATYGVVGGFLFQLGVSMVLSRIAMALRGKPKQQELLRELQQPDSLPVWRYVYGRTMAPGTPAPVRVKGRVLYGCYILNSRPSAGPFTVYFDKREVEATGDTYDFSGGGATATNAPFSGHVRYWIGRGSQVGPPTQIVSEAPEHFSSTDAWQGMTVLWVRLDAGENSTRGERWPATPPEVLVHGDWSLIWDMRDPTQDPDDPATWKWSANHALCVLDALRTNPMRPYADRYLWTDTFEWAADVADEPVPVKDGGTIPRYETNGVLAFSRGVELEDQVVPLAQAGAGRFVRVGGRLGLVPGTYSAPVATLTDVLGDTPLSFTRYRPSSELVTEVSATYSNPDRLYEDAETPVHVLAGAQAADGGVGQLGQYDLQFVTDHRQAQRVAKILGMRTRMQRTLGGTFPPSAFKLVGGSPVTVSLPAPYTHRNGIYEVEEAHPGLDIVGQDGVAMRVGLSLRETTAAVYAWDHEAEEQDVAEETFDPDVSVAAPPTGLLVAIATVSFTPVVEFSFVPSSSGNVLAYEWEISTNAGATWQTGGTLDPATVDSGRIRGSVVATVSGLTGIRARAVGSTGASTWAGPEYVSVSHELIIDGGVF